MRFPKKSKMNSVRCP